MNKITKPNCHRTPRCILVSFIVFSLVLPVSALAEDSKSIDTLRQLGKAFASIADKASPAVVGISAKQAIIQQYYPMQDWPFGNSPFNDDFFDQFFGRQFRRQQRLLDGWFAPTDKTDFLVEYGFTAGSCTCSGCG